MVEGAEGILLLGKVFTLEDEQSMLWCLLAPAALIMCHKLCGQLLTVFIGIMHPLMISN